VLAPTAYGVCNFVRNRARFILGIKPDPFWTTFSNCCVQTVGVLQIVSGLILVWSTISIHRFFKARNQTDYINTPMLLRHAAAYALYLLSSMFYFGSLFVYILSPFSAKASTVFLYSVVIFMFAQMISELLLMTIFWDLGKALELEESFVSEIEAVDFDEDAELQARMWNHLVRPEVASMMVTSSRMSVKASVIR
jgi:hypothetical protein